MERTVLALFAEKDADEVVQALRASSVSLHRVVVIADETEDSSREVGPQGTLRSPLEARLESQFGEGLLPGRAAHFAERLREGSVLVAAQVPSPQAESTRCLMERHHPLEFDELSEAWEQRHAKSPAPSARLGSDNSPRSKRSLGSPLAPKS